jgi:hypothetical protein
LSVSRFQKIFLASTLVVAGFGVAKFLGQPVLPRQLFSSRGDMVTTPVVVQSAPAAIAESQAMGNVRLVPDSPPMHAGAPPINSETAIPQPPRLGNALAPVLATTEKVDTSPPRAFEFSSISSAPIGESDSPHARLRNEAPRPVGVDPQSPVAIRRLPPEGGDAPDPYKVADTKAAPQAWSAPALLNAGYTATAPPPPSALRASYSAPANIAAENQVSQPTWPAPDEAAESRTHVVVDGDSLERIASRYLSDPQRSREIFELNRSVLSSPDLLPIGAELKIPERVTSSSWDRRTFQPNSASANPNREVGRENMTPARPAAAPQVVIPRAQLAPPMMVQ